MANKNINLLTKSETAFLVRTLKCMLANHKRTMYFADKGSAIYKESAYIFNTFENLHKSGKSEYERARLYLSFLNDYLGKLEDTADTRYEERNQYIVDKMHTIRIKMSNRVQQLKEAYNA